MAIQEKYRPEMLRFAFNENGVKGVDLTLHQEVVDDQTGKIYVANTLGPFSPDGPEAEAAGFSLTSILDAAAKDAITHAIALQAENDSMSDKITDLNEEIVRLTDANAGLTTELADMTTDNQTLKSQLVIAAGTIDTANARIGGLQENVATLNAQNVELEARVAELLAQSLSKDEKIAALTPAPAAEETAPTETTDQ